MAGTESRPSRVTNSLTIAWRLGSVAASASQARDMLLRQMAADKTPRDGQAGESQSSHARVDKAKSSAASSGRGAERQELTDNGGPALFHQDRGPPFRFNPNLKTQAIQPARVSGSEPRRAPPPASAGAGPDAALLSPESPRPRRAAHSKLDPTFFRLAGIRMAMLARRSLVAHGMAAARRV